MFTETQLRNLSFSELVSYLEIHSEDPVVQLLIERIQEEQLSLKDGTEHWD